MPDYVGLQKVVMVWMPMTDIEFNKINHARVDGASKVKVNEISNAIKKGNYLPFAYEPPMVEFNEKTGKYDVLTGNHRYQGHQLAGETEMWVAIVEFDTKRNRKIAQSIENSEKKGIDFGQEFRKEKDVVRTAIDILQDIEANGEEVLESTITEVLGDLKVTKKTELNTMKIAIANNLKNPIEWATTITEGQLKSTALEIEDNDPTVKTVIKFFGTVHEGSRRADKALFDAAMKVKEEYGAETKVKMVVAFHDLSADQIPFARKSRKVIFSEKEAQAVKQAELINSPNYTSPEFVHLDQIISDNIKKG